MCPLRTNAEPHLHLVLDLQRAQQRAERRQTQVGLPDRQARS